MVVCADVGSTYTKVAVVDVAGGGLVATAAHPTTLAEGPLAGLKAAAAATAEVGGVAVDEWYVCSSAGGGLRLAVIGYEELVTAEAGQRVGLSAGARVVHVAAGRLDRAGLAGVRAARPDVVLLVGGTDGGDAETLLHNAARLSRWRVPTVVAGNADARDEVAAVLPHAVVTANVLPRIGVLHPGPARAAIREVFLRHVIGGRFGRRFARLVKAATPDAVLTAVELMADHTGGGLLVVDVGGATTDVYSALPPAAPGAATGGAGAPAPAPPGRRDPRGRGDAAGVLAAATAERIAHSGLVAAAEARAADPRLLTDDGVDRELATLAATVAVRRHARGDAGGRGRRDLRDVRLVVGSGGVLRHAKPPDALGVLDAVLSDHGGGWPVPLAADRVIDGDYVLAAAGLLAADHPAAALALLETLPGKDETRRAPTRRDG
ncbi:glutamate mutase L [Micromonospora sp. CPCC 205371]|nr:glutamate mutase L [Micromonospora sp. CPCC 205371]